MASYRFKELYSKAIWSSDKSRTDFRLIEYVNKGGETVIKFGFSEFYFCEPLGRWLPSKKHHHYLPLTAWTAVIAHNQLVESAIEKQTQVALAQARQDGAGDTAAGQHGRPPKRAYVRRANTDAGEHSADGATASTKDAESSKKKAKRGRPRKNVEPPEEDNYAGDDSDSQWPFGMRESGADGIASDMRALPDEAH